MLYRERTLQTKHGPVQTPTLFPVRNIGKRSTDNTPGYTSRIPDLNTAMVNTRAILNRDPQWDRLQGDSTLRGEMGVEEDTIVFADSGGFDFEEQEQDVSPEEILRAQETIGADLLGTVDLPLSRENRREENQRRIDASTQNAIAASDAHDGDGHLIASVHGYDPETVRNGIEYLESNGDFDGYAVGSLVPIRTDYEKVTKLILAARRATDKHLHVYGLGGITYQPLLLYLGVDSFDSTAFIRSAGNRNYLVPGFGCQPMKDITSLDRLPCACPICGDATLSELRANRELLTRHNLWAIVTELRRFRFMVAADAEIEEYLEMRFLGNPVTNRAFETAKQQVRRLA
jgi:tRNA-guanine family transglycosylase